MLYYKYLFRGTFFILQIAPDFFRVFFVQNLSKICPKTLKSTRKRKKEKCLKWLFLRLFFTLFFLYNTQIFP